MKYLLEGEWKVQFQTKTYIFLLLEGNKNVWKGNAVYMTVTQ